MATIDSRKIPKEIDIRILPNSIKEKFFFKDREIIGYKASSLPSKPSYIKLIEVYEMNGKITKV